MDYTSELLREFSAGIENGIERFNGFFNRFIGQRKFDECQLLLDFLATIQQPVTEQAFQHYKGILIFYETHHFAEAENIWRSLLSQPALTTLQKARTSLALAILLDELGQWDEALPYYQAALAGYQAANNRLGYCRTLNNLGIMRTYQYEQGTQESQYLAEAIKYHQQAIQQCNELLVDTFNQNDAITEELAKNWHGCGRSLAFQGNYQAANEAFQQLFALCEGASDAYKLGVGLSDLAALVYRPQGNLLAAEKALNESIQFLKDEDPLHLAEALTRLGDVFQSQGLMKEALQYYDDAVNCIESIRQIQSAESTAASLRATTEFIYAAPIGLCLRQGDARLALTYSERARSRVFADLLASQSPAPRNSTSVLQQERNSLFMQLEQAYVTKAEPERVNELEAALTRLDRQFELLESSIGGLQASTALTADEIVKRLSPDSTLLIYVSDNEYRLHCLVIAARKISAIALNPKMTTHWLQAHLIPYLEGKRPGFLPDRTNSLLQASSIIPDLYNGLLTPILPYIGESQSIYIVPTGPLHYLPLGALFSTQEKDPPLLIKRRVIYAPSASILLDYCYNRTPSSNRGTFAIASSEVDLTLIQGCARTLAHSSDSASLIGDEVSIQSLLERASQYRVFCFLGHAVFNGRYPMLSYLKIADRRFYANEIMRSLRINADLVVLAACESGRGQILNGDELFGLTRSILYAGTAAVLATLWRVHEIPTRLLLEKLWHHSAMQVSVQEGFNPGLALAEAQNWLRTLTYSAILPLVERWDDQPTASILSYIKELWQQNYPNKMLEDNSCPFAHPYFWSPYILIGEGAIS